MKIDSNSNIHATAAGNAKLNKFAPILFYWSILHTCAPSSANKRNDMSEGVWRAAVIASNKRIEHTSRRATFKSFMTFFFTKEIAKLMQTRSISILYYTLIVCCQCTYTVQLPYGANFDLSTINKKKQLQEFVFIFFSPLFSNCKCFDAMERRRYDKLRIYECWIPGYWILFALFSFRFISRSFVAQLWMQADVNKCKLNK